VPEDNPLDKPPGMSRKYGPSIGMSSNSRLIWNKKIISNRVLGRPKKILGIGYEFLTDTSFFTIEGKLYRKILFFFP